MAQKIKYLVMDVDGTLTDGKIYMGDNGELFKAFHIKDGCGIHDILIPEGIVPIIITGRTSRILERRCSELGITQLYQGIDNKLEKLHEVIKNKSLDTVAYIGDDINDLACMEAVRKSKGLTGCPLDAVKEIKSIADFVSEKNGGQGAVREFIEFIINC